MTSPKVPPGDEGVALGNKLESKGSKQKTGFATHKAGTHTEADYAHQGKVPSKSQSIKAPTSVKKGGPGANVR
jgi:hypothetical protein